MAATTANRSTRTEMVEDPEGRGQSPLWVLYERDCMFDVVTRERLKLGKEPLPMLEVVKVERSAQGHSDYGDKFAIGCAELVWELP